MCHFITEVRVLCKPRILSETRRINGLQCFTTVQYLIKIEVINNCGTTYYLVA